MGGRFKDYVLAEVYDRAINIQLMKPVAHIGYPRVEGVRVDVEFLGDILEELIEHRKTLGLVDGCEKEE